MLQEVKDTIAVIGPEGTGSKLCARTIATALGICSFNSWEGFLWAPYSLDCPTRVDGINTAVFHNSVPSGEDKKVLNIENLIRENENIKFVLPTRDKNISKLSRGYSYSEHRSWIKENEDIIKIIKFTKSPYMFFSYETFMLYPEIYVQELYSFLEIKSSFIPDLTDANIKYLRS